MTGTSHVVLDTCTLENFAVVKRPDLLETLFRCPEAYELLRAMADAGRGVAMPASHWYVCPC